MSQKNQTAQINKIHGIAQWLEDAWKAVNEPESGIVAVDVRQLVTHLKGLKRDSIPELVAAARDLGDNVTKNALLDGAKLEDVLAADLIKPPAAKGKSVLDPLFQFGMPLFWRGGDAQPVADDTIVHVVTVNGLFVPNTAAKHFDWGKRSDGHEILAFVVDQDPYKHLRFAAAAGKRVEFRDPRGFWAESGFMHFPESFVTTAPVDRFRVVEQQVASHRHLGISLLGRHGEPILWEGGEQPVPDDARVDVVTNNGQFLPGLKASHHDWDNRGPFGIHAFIVRKGQKSRPNLADQKVASQDWVEVTGRGADAIAAYLQRAINNVVSFERLDADQVPAGHQTNKSPQQIPAFLLRRVPVQGRSAKGAARE